MEKESTLSVLCYVTLRGSSVSNGQLDRKSVNWDNRTEHKLRLVPCFKGARASISVRTGM